MNRRVNEHIQTKMCRHGTVPPHQQPIHFPAFPHTPKPPTSFSPSGAENHHPRTFPSEFSHKPVFLPTGNPPTGLNQVFPPRNGTQPSPHRVQAGNLQSTAKQAPSRQNPSPSPNGNPTTSPAQNLPTHSQTLSLAVQGISRPSESPNGNHLLSHLDKISKGIKRYSDLIVIF